MLNVSLRLLFLSLASSSIASCSLPFLLSPRFLISTDPTESTATADGESTGVLSSLFSSLSCVQLLSSCLFDDAVSSLLIVCSSLRTQTPNIPGLASKLNTKVHISEGMSHYYSFAWLNS